MQQKKTPAEQPSFIWHTRMSASNNNNKTNDDENASLLKKKQDSDGLVVVLTDKPSAAVSNKRNLLILIILLVLIPLSMVVLAMLLLSGAVVYYNIPNEHVPNPLFPLNGLFFGVVWFSNSSGVLFNSTVAVNNPNFDMKKNKTVCNAIQYTYIIVSSFMYMDGSEELRLKDIMKRL